MDLKPDVCWQLPLRREERDDGGGHITSTIVEWKRSDWGGGGDEFHWWCTEAPEAFAGAGAVYRTMADELVGLVGDEVYARLAAYLDARSSGSVPLPHPAVRDPPVTVPRRFRPLGPASFYASPMRARSALALVAVASVLAGCGSAKRTAGPPRTLYTRRWRRRRSTCARSSVPPSSPCGSPTPVKATDRATQIVAGAGGLVFAQRSDLAGHQETRMTLKVPPAAFEPVMGALGDLGLALHRESKAQDVTDQVVDVDGRLKTSLASADRLRALLGDARSTGDIVGLEAELAKRETEIETLQGRLRVLASQTDMATIDLRLTERGDLEVRAEIPAFTRALGAGWSAVGVVARAGAAAAGFLLPFSPLVLAGWWALRRRRPALEEEIP